ncbi:unnamed protein product [Schistocephalus solidus]|uniref:N-acetyllactosaminide beta-1,6-N-acetylglucosaminyl-transferase n=1 Tax=Schistocephalus solidus TaxID=70667 RepID=A0A183S9F6_SCHSO|nr:unnamed protein product [Schistocephalus solidus]
MYMGSYSKIKISILCVLFLLAVTWYFGLQINKKKLLYGFSETNKTNRCDFLFAKNSSNEHHEFKRLTPLYRVEYFLSLNKAAGQLCNAFKRDLFPTKVPITVQEMTFPLGFVLTVHKSISQVARLLRLIYRPQNVYVIHVDRKTSLEFYEAVQEIAKCFGTNAAVVPRNESINVIWGDYTVLEQELVAARMLLQMGKWKYFINLTGQELPLKTNLELVLALNMLNGSNIIDATLKHRFKFRMPRRRASFPVSSEFFKMSLFHVVVRHRSSRHL